MHRWLMPMALALLAVSVSLPAIAQNRAKDGADLVDKDSGPAAKKFAVEANKLLAVSLEGTRTPTRAASAQPVRGR